MIQSRRRHVVVLLPSVEAVTAREAGRGRKGCGTWSVEELHGGFARSTPRIGIWLDTSLQTPEETVAEILSRTVAH
jgi:chloramphenicol 3-O-phosphotransferase